MTDLAATAIEPGSTALSPNEYGHFRLAHLLLYSPYTRHSGHCDKFRFTQDKEPMKLVKSMMFMMIITGVLGLALTTFAMV
jgi:hypothetical protein